VTVRTQANALVLILTRIWRGEFGNDWPAQREALARSWGEPILDRVRVARVCAELSRMEAD